MDAARIKSRAGELGLDVCGVTSADPARHAAFYRQWTDGATRARCSGWRGNRSGAPILAWCFPARGASSWRDSIIGSRSRRAGDASRGMRWARISSRLLEKLEALAAEIVASGEPSGARAKIYVDTGPVLEKPLAERAGVGWQGKSTMLIHRRLGPWLLLGEIITTLELEPDRRSATIAARARNASRRVRPGPSPRRTSSTRGAASPT